MSYKQSTLLRLTTGPTSLVGQALLALVLVTAGVLLLRSDESREISRPFPVDTREASFTSSRSGRATKPIEQVQVGDRVFGENPLGQWDGTFGPVEATTWRRVELRAPKRDGQWADMTLLRPLWWLDAQGATVGGTIHIAVPECGIDGNAEVLAIGRCPEPAPGTGHIVTGTFRHSAATLVDLRLSGTDEVISTTVNHPFWSEDHRKFLRADQLLPGERLRGLTGTVRLAAIQRRPEPDAVFNIEVHGTHVYHVGLDAVLVHNGGGACPAALEDMFKDALNTRNRFTHDYLINTGKPKVFAGAPNGKVFISGYAQKLDAVVTTDLKLATFGKWSPNQVTRVKEIVKYFDEIGAPLRAAGAQDRIPGYGDVYKAYNASHSEIQAAFDILIANKAHRDTFLNGRELIIGITDRSGPCKSCQEALLAMAREEGVTIRIDWLDPSGNLGWTLRFK